MAETQGNMNPLGFEAPDFKLKDVISGQHIRLSDVKSNKATVIMFICNHCPFVKHVNDQLVKLATDYIPEEIVFIAISANDAEKHPEDSPVKMQEYAKRLGYPFPYLYDETQEVAKAYDAACTPDFYIFDREMRCVYHGQLDDSRPSNDKPVTGQDIRNALDAILEDREVNPNQKPSIGCNIKWKK